MATNLGLKAGVPQQQLSSQTWKVLLYGVSGAGKTRTASLWPKPLFIDFDHGLASIDRKIAWVRIEKWADWKAFHDQLMTQRLPVETLVIDSIPAMQRMAMEASVGGYQARRAHGDIPGQSDYGKMFWDVWRALDELLDLPYHKVLITQCILGTFGELHRPTFVGQAIQDPVLQAMDLIGYVEKTGPRETTLAFDRPDAVTKDRFGIFDDARMANPTWAGIEGRAKPKRKEKAPEIQEGTPAG